MIDRGPPMTFCGRPTFGEWARSNCHLWQWSWWWLWWKWWWWLWWKSWSQSNETFSFNSCFLIWWLSFITSRYEFYHGDVYDDYDDGNDDYDDDGDDVDDDWHFALVSLSTRRLSDDLEKPVQKMINAPLNKFSFSSFLAFLWNANLMRHTSYEKKTHVGKPMNIFWKLSGSMQSDEERGWFWENTVSLGSRSKCARCAVSNSNVQHIGPFVQFFFTPSKTMPPPCWGKRERQCIKNANNALFQVLSMYYMYSGEPKRRHPRGFGESWDSGSRTLFITDQSRYN